MPQTEGSPKRGDKPLYKDTQHLFFRLPRTSGDASAIMLTSELSFVQNLPEWDKKELASQLAHNLFKAGTIFSLVSIGLGGVFVLGNSSKEMDTWKGEVEFIKLKCSNLQKELLALNKEVKASNSLKEVVVIQGSSSALVARMIVLESSLKDE